MEGFGVSRAWKHGMGWVGRQLKDHGQSSFLQAQSNLEKSYSTDLTAMSIPGFSLSLFSSCFTRQQPPGFWGHRDPLWGEQWERRPRVQRQVQEMGSAQLPWQETQPHLRPGMEPWGAQRHQNLPSAPHQSCSSCVKARGKAGVKK